MVPHSYLVDLKIAASALRRFAEHKQRAENRWTAEMQALVDRAIRLEGYADGRDGPEDASPFWWRDALRERPHPKLLVIAWTKEYGALLADRTTSNPQFGWSCDGTVTHWMPIPDAPSATDSEGDKS